MSRLIDGDALIEELREKVAHFNYFKGLVQAQPTAFDTEKVVAELEEKANFFGTPSMGSLQKFGYCMGINDAIDIVKRGGIE